MKLDKWGVTFIHFYQWYQNYAYEYALNHSAMRVELKEVVLKNKYIPGSK